LCGGVIRKKEKKNSFFFESLSAANAFVWHQVADRIQQPPSILGFLFEVLQKRKTLFLPKTFTSLLLLMQQAAPF
jgi:hypothetical protein